MFPALQFPVVIETMAQVINVLVESPSFSHRRNSSAQRSASDLLLEEGTFAGSLESIEETIANAPHSGVANRSTQSPTSCCAPQSKCAVNYAPRCCCIVVMLVLTVVVLAVLGYFAHSALAQTEHEHALTSASAGESVDCTPGSFNSVGTWSDGSATACYAISCHVAGYRGEAGHCTCDIGYFPSSSRGVYYVDGAPFGCELCPPEHIGSEPIPGEASQPRKLLVDDPNDCPSDHRLNATLVISSNPRSTIGSMQAIRNELNILRFGVVSYMQSLAKLAEQPPSKRQRVTEAKGRRIVSPTSPQPSGQRSSYLQIEVLFDSDIHNATAPSARFFLRVHSPLPPANWNTRNMSFASGDLYAVGIILHHRNGTTELQFSDNWSPLADNQRQLAYRQVPGATHINFDLSHLHSSATLYSALMNPHNRQPRQDAGGRNVLVLRQHVSEAFGAIMEGIRQDGLLRIVARGLSLLEHSISLPRQNNQASRIPGVNDWFKNSQALKPAVKVLALGAMFPANLSIIIHTHGPRPS